MLVLDAGALVAGERSDRDVIALIKRERLAGRTPITHGGIQLRSAHLMSSSVAREKLEI